MGVMNPPKGGGGCCWAIRRGNLRRTTTSTTTTMVMTTVLLLLVVDLACYLTTPVSAFQPASPLLRQRLRRQQHARESMILMAIPVLKDWKVLPNGRVEGIIVSHPEWQAGSILSTSPLRNNPEEAAADGKQVILVETISGSQYILLNNDDRPRPSTFPPAEPASNKVVVPTNSFVLVPPQPTATTATTSYENSVRISDDGMTSNRLDPAPVPPPNWGWNSNSNDDETASWGWDKKPNPVTSPAAAVGRNSVQNYNPENENERAGTSSNSSTNKKTIPLLLEQVKDAGIAGIISYAVWELGFWTVSVPVCIGAYREVTGHWPDWTSPEELQQLGAGAFAFVNVARLAVPLRIGLALSTTPWVEKNIVQRFLLSKKENNEE